MTNARKYIWSVYVLLWVYFIFFDASFEQDTHIFTYLIFGWIPFIAISWIWGKDNNHSKNNHSPETDEKYSSLYRVIDREHILKVLQTGKDAKISLEENHRRLNDFGTTANKDLDVLEKNNEEIFKLSIDQMREYFQIKDNINAFQMFVDYVEEYSKVLEEINKQLEKGISPETARKIFDELISEINEKKTEAQMRLIGSRVSGEELVKSLTELKKKKPNASISEINQIRIDGNTITKRIKEEAEKEFGVKLDE